MQTNEWRDEVNTKKLLSILGLAGVAVHTAGAAVTLARASTSPASLERMLQEDPTGADAAAIFDILAGNNGNGGGNGGGNNGGHGGPHGGGNGNGTGDGDHNGNGQGNGHDGNNGHGDEHGNDDEHGHYEG